MLADLIPPQNRGPGLSESELSRAQAEAEVAFPPDLCELLTATLPTGRGFPDWRMNPGSEIARWRETLRHGILFNVTSPDDNFWTEEWGPRPANENDAVEVVTELLERAPVLIPIYGHRCIPSEPLLAGNPVFSVVQIDTSVLGADLEDYLQRQFGPDARREDDLPVGRPIRFWTALAYDHKVSVHDYENWNRGLPRGKYRTYYLKEGPGTNSPLRIVRNVKTGEAYWMSKYDGDGETYVAFYRIAGSGNWVQ